MLCWPNTVIDGYSFVGVIINLVAGGTLSELF